VGRNNDKEALCGELGVGAVGQRRKCSCDHGRDERAAFDGMETKFNENHYSVQLHPHLPTTLRITLSVMIEIARNDMSWNKGKKRLHLQSFVDDRVELLHLPGTLTAAQLTVQIRNL
jgi:hypothetical protein